MGTVLLNPWVLKASVARSLLTREKGLSMIWENLPMDKQLWWGPIIDVRPGDRVLYFRDATGDLHIDYIIRREWLEEVH